VRPDKNKAEVPTARLARSLAALQQDLERTLVFLAAYERSRHRQRGEALRWLVPVLREWTIEIRSLTSAGEAGTESR